MKIKQLFWRKCFYIFLGLILGIFIGLISPFLGRKLVKILIKEKTINQISDSIIAPYYEAKVFKKPPDLVAKDIAKAGVAIQAKMKIPIIMYHYVEYVKDIEDLIKKKLSINPYIFEKQLQVLKTNHFETYFVKDIPDILDGKIDYSSKSAIFTFDDGYEDFYTVVFPLLKKYQIKSTIYIIYDFIGRKGFLTEQQIKELINSHLVEIGSHTLDHLYLKLTPEKTARRQIFESKAQLEKTFGIEIKTFAYPYGAFSQETVDLVKEATYSAAVSVISGTVQSQNNLFYLSRLRAGQFTEQNIVQILEKSNK